MEEKICSKCKKFKLLCDFPVDKAKASGYRGYCKTCAKIGRKVYYEKNKDRTLKKAQQFYADNREQQKARQKQKYRDNPVTGLFYAARDRAPKLGIPWNLELSDIHVPDKCPVFGTPFVVGDNDRAASLDRTRPELGYVKGNVQVISFRANRLKSNGTLDELKALVSWLEKQKTPEGLSEAQTYAVPA